MSTLNLPQVYKGLSGGTSSERTQLNVLPTTLEEDSRNVEILRDNSIRPRRGADFIGQSDLGNYMVDTRSVSRATQDSPSAIYALFRGTSGEIIEKHIVFHNNVFKIYAIDNLVNFDAPDQTINPGTRVATDMHHYSLSFSKGDNKVFFAGRKIQPGYLWLDTDNVTINVTYISVHERDLKNNSAASSRVQYLGKYYECVEAHTAAATDVTNVDAFGETVFNRYWMELSNTAIPMAAPTWTATTAYTTNIKKIWDKYDTLPSNNPHRCRFWNNRLILMTDDKIYISKISVDVDNESIALVGTNPYSLYLQMADPYDTSDPDLVPSDGLYISIPIGRGYDIEVTEDALFVGTSLKIFEIRGDTGRFTATDFKISEVINEGINGVDNLVNADNKLYVFGTNSIWGAVDQQRYYSGSVTTFAKIANKQIRDYYATITKLNKGTGRAVYSTHKEKLYFFHNQNNTQFDELYRDINGENGYARHILIIDVSNVTQDLSVVAQGEIFIQGQVEIWEYKDSAHQDEPYIAFAYDSAPVSSSISKVVVGSTQIVVGSSAVVVSGQTGSQNGSDELVLIVLSRSASQVKYSIGVLESQNLKDWESDATRTQDYHVYARLGTQVMDTVIDNKQVGYCAFVFEKLDAGTGSCLFRSSFNFSDISSNGAGTGKTSGTTEVYQDTKTVGNGGSVSLEGYKATVYKHRVRGRGIAFQPALENTPGKDFRLLGWGQLVKMKRR